MELEIKTDDDFDKDLLKLLEVFNLPGIDARLKGSAQYKYLNYKSDYDLLSQIRRTTPASEIFLGLQKVLQKIELNTEMYFIELKYHMNDDHKIRLHPGDIFGMADLDRHYSKLKFIKIDTVCRLRDKFYEITCVYMFEDEVKSSVPDVVKRLNDDIKEFIDEGNYFKVLKRLFSIAIIYKNTGMAQFYLRVFNSELGKMYEIYCNLNAIDILHTYYKDKSVMEKIEKNLKLIDENISLKNMKLYMNRYSKELNTKAKQIYRDLKKLNKI